MAIINQSNILNLQPGITAPVVVHMSEGDSGTKLSFKLIDGARAWTDPGNVVAAVHGRRQDGTQFGPYACTISGDVVSFQTDAAMAGAAGSGIAQIVLTDNDGNTAGSANFAVMVERATFPMGVTYVNDKSVYEAILRYVQTIPAQVTRDYTTKIEAETSARIAADTSLQNQITAEVDARANQDSVLSARMDEFTKLPDGSLSTAADAELVDIRVKADGTKASTAGNAVREQITELKSALNEQAHEDILDNEYIYGVPFHSYEKTIEPNTGTQMLYNVQGISCFQFVNRFTDYDFSGGGLTMKINYSDETEATIGFGENTNNYIFYAGNHGAITGVRVYSNTGGLTANAYVKGVVLFGKEGNDLKSIINTINKNIAGLQTKLFQTGVSRSDTVKDFTDFGESWNIDIAITAPHRIAYCQTVFRLASEKITGINSIRVKGTIIPRTDNIDNIRIFDADQFASYTYSGNYADIAVDGDTSFDETIALTGLESATINVGISVGSSHTTEYHTNWQYLLHGLEVYVNGQRVYGQELTFRGMIGFNSNTYTLNNSAYYNKEIATLPLSRSDISDTIKDQSYINIQAAVTQPDRVAHLQNLFSLTVPKYESIEKIRVKGIFVPKTENINIVRFYQADQMDTTAGGASTGKFLPTGEYAEIEVNTLQETEIDETIYPSGLSDNIESVVFAVARNATTAYNTAWTWDFNNLQIFINDKLLPIDSIIFRGYIGFSGYTPDIERINVPDIITSDDLQDYMSKFAGVPAPNVLPIGKNFATGTLAVERSADTSAFDAGYCESPVVWWDSNKLKYGMVYTGYSIGSGGSPYGFGQVGLAWSDDLVNWEKDENAPILSPSHVEGDPDRGSITGPVMLLRDGVYYLYYIGCSEEGYEMGTKTLCLATGTDIYNLTKFEHNPIIAPQPTNTTSPYRHNIYHANIVFGTDKYYMFINCSGVRPTDQHACENILLFTSNDLYNWNYDSVVLEGGTSTTDPDYAICGDPCIFDIGDDNLYMTIFRVTSGGVGTGTGLARTSKKEFPYGWKKYDFRFGSGIKAYVTFKGDTMYHFYNENSQIYIQTSN